MVTTTRRTGERGQRTPRSMGVYQAKGGMSGEVRCRCGAVLHNKSWHQGTPHVHESGQTSIVCPACQRIADHNPAGVVTLSGTFFSEHHTEIDQLLVTLTEHEATKNPLCRVIAMNRGDGGITIKTTNTKLAQKIGRTMFKTYGGDLAYRWRRGDELVRVSWSRS